MLISSFTPSCHEKELPRGGYQTSIGNGVSVGTSVGASVAGDVSGEADVEERVAGGIAGGSVVDSAGAAHPLIKMDNVKRRGNSRFILCSLLNKKIAHQLDALFYFSLLGSYFFLEPGFPLFAFPDHKDGGCDENGRVGSAH